MNWNSNKVVEGALSAGKDSTRCFQPALLHHRERVVQLGCRTVADPDVEL